MPSRADRRWGLPVFAAVTLLAAFGIGLCSAWWIGLIGRDSRLTSAYAQGHWTESAELARQALAKHKDDLAALRLLARSYARLGKDSTATSIYQHRLAPTELEAEDYLVAGLMLKRQGRGEDASRAWNKVLGAPVLTPRTLEELGQLAVQSRRFEQAINATERLRKEPGWGARGALMLGTIHAELNNIPAAATLFEQALRQDLTVLDASREPEPLRKLIARVFLRDNRPNQALPLLQAILDHGSSPEAAWLMSRAYLQLGQKTEALAAIKLAGNYAAAHPLEPEPSPYVGEAHCESCHSKIYRDSLSSRHTRTYYHGKQLDEIPLPDQPLPDPDDPEVKHRFERRDGALHEQTQVGKTVFDAVIEYAFGTTDRYLTMVSRDADHNYHISRLSYYQTEEGKGWDRSALDATHPSTRSAAAFQGEQIGVRAGLAKCLFCHTTNPRTGNESPGPETADRAIGCERCHGPGGNHIAALELGFPDLAITNPATASPQAVSAKQCNECHVLEHKIPENDPENPGWIRSQGIGWSRSRCTTESNGTFGCVTCHDPHQPARTLTVADYENKCLKCHGPTAQPSHKTAAVTPKTHTVPAQSRSCPVNPGKGCLECHMPRVHFDDLHMSLTDHFIRVRRPKK